MKVMKMVLVLMAFVGFCFRGVSWAGEGDEVVSLSDCIQKALADNPSLTVAQDDVSISRARQRAATVSLLPALSGKLDETTGKILESTLINKDFIERSYGVQGTLSLFSGGKLWGTRRQAVISSEVAQLQLEKQKLDVRHAVTEAYWRVVAVQRALSTHQTTHESLQQDLEKAVRHELSEARSARIELLSTRAQNRESESALAELEEDVIEARMGLLDAIGQKIPLNFAVPDDIPEGTVTVDLDEALRLARAHRPDLKIADRMMESARWGRVVGRSGFYPKVDVNGFYGRSGSAFVQSEPLTYQKDWNAGVTASWALGGNTAKASAFQEHTSPKLGESSRTSTESQSLTLTLGDAMGVGVTHRESKKTFHEEAWRYEKARRDIDSEVRLAVQRVVSARRRCDAARSKMQEAQQELKSTRSLLQDDRAHLGDFAAAKNRLAFAEAGYAQSKAQFLIAVSGLNRTVGIADQYRVMP